MFTVTWKRIPFFISVFKPHQTNGDISRNHLAAAALFVQIGSLHQLVPSRCRKVVVRSFIDGEKEKTACYSIQKCSQNFCNKAELWQRGWTVSGVED